MCNHQLYYPIINIQIDESIIDSLILDWVGIKDNEYATMDKNTKIIYQEIWTCTHQFYYKIVIIQI
jgi:hypothetical protein